MPISRAAAEIEPVRAIAASRSARPGPIAITAPIRMRIFGTSGLRIESERRTPFAQETWSQYSSTLGDCRLPRQTVSRPSAAQGTASRAAHGHRQIRDFESPPRAGQLRRGVSLLAQARLRQLRRPGGADRDDAPGSGRAETLDLREEISARAQLLHGTAGAGGPAARHLYRLDDAPDLGWSDIGRPFRAAVAVHPDRADMGLPRVRQRAARGRAVLRNQAGGDGDRLVRRVPHRVARTQ